MTWEARDGDCRANSADRHRQNIWASLDFGVYSGHLPLNPAQLAAATHPPAPLLIIAGAGTGTGTGKTNTLAHRVAHLITTGADPGRILLLTFTRRAAEIMTRRAEQIVGRQALSAFSNDSITCWWMNIRIRMRSRQNYRSVQPILDAANAVIGVESVLAAREAGTPLPPSRPDAHRPPLRPARDRAGPPATSRS